MNNFDEALVYLFRNEGVKFVDDPTDSGGPTKWGISQRFLSAHLKRQVQAEEIAALTFEDVQTIYRENFWEPLRCNEIKKRLIAIAIFDCGVLFGVRTSGIIAQQALISRGFNLKVDGIIGEKTLQALNYMDTNRFLLNVQNLLLQRIDVICENDPKNERFRIGWQNRAQRLANLATEIQVKS